MSHSNETKDLIGVISEVTITECAENLRDAHDYLAKCGRTAMVRAAEISQSSWGAFVKRIKVVFPSEGKPGCIRLTEHNLIEVINQCATLERLLDAITWTSSMAPDLRDFNRVIRCHPTTSSNKNDGGYDNDLVLSNGTDCVRFEVSDVTGERDGNRKERKDLISLGVLCEGNHKTCMNIPGWPKDRVFLVVSSEFSNGILSRKPSWIKEKHCRYVKSEQGGTSIIEVLKGCASTWPIGH